jgi:3-oxoacyl-(acyl-carrier-protein) synthase III
MRRVAVLAGVGGYVPSAVITNAELASRFDTSEEWIQGRTGIRSRRHVAPGVEATSDLAVAAGRAALADVEGAVDTVLLATTTPDQPCPATAPLVAHQLGLGEVAAIDLAAVCSGFVYGLAVADGLIAAGTARRVLLIGADTFSTIIHPGDRGAGSLFGDGAGAVVLRAGEPDEPGAVLAVDLGSDGGLADLIAVRAGGSRHPDTRTADERSRYFAMHGQAVYRHAVRRMTATARTVLTRTGWQPSDVDCLVAHQANARILETVGAELGIGPDRVYRNIAAVGNTAAGSIPLALADAATTGVLRPGDRVLLSAFGGGATWGAAALTWPDLTTRKENDEARAGALRGT